MNYRGLLLNLLAALLIAAPSLAAVVSAITVPATRAGGYTVTAADLNADVGGLYSSINNGIIATLNKLTTKGDIYVYDGAALQRQGVGANNTVLTADSAQANGIKWAALANTTQLTTKGDLLTFTTVPARIGVGTNGQVLTADSTVSAGVKWATPSAAIAIPVGTIIAWSPAAAGTNTVPSGWQLCNGSGGSPNLIGRFILGGRPSGDTSAASSGGFGIETVDANGTGVTSVLHSHNQLGTFTTSTNNATNNAVAGATPVAGTHTHTVTLSGNTNIADAPTEPADYVLVYIMKT